MDFQFKFLISKKYHWLENLLFLNVLNEILVPSLLQGFFGINSNYDFYEHIFLDVNGQIQEVKCNNFWFIIFIENTLYVKFWKKSEPTVNILLESLVVLNEWFILFGNFLLNNANTLSELNFVWIKCRDFRKFWPILRKFFNVKYLKSWFSWKPLGKLGELVKKGPICEILFSRKF